MQGSKGENCFSSRDIGCHSKQLMTSYNSVQFNFGCFSNDFYQIKLNSTIKGKAATHCALWLPVCSIYTYMHVCVQVLKSPVGNNDEGMVSAEQQCSVNWEPCTRYVISVGCPVRVTILMWLD